MGWLYFDRDKTQTLADWFREHVNGEYGKHRTTVLDVAVVKFRTLYAAVETVDRDSGERFVWAAVYLLDNHGDGSFNFGYKSGDESVGPRECECPKRILDLLTPTDSQWANEWRARCRANLAKKKTVPKLQVGDKLTFKDPVHFNNGLDLSEFTVRSTKPLRFDSPSFYGLIRLTRDLLTTSIESGRCVVTRDPQKVVPARS